MIMARLRGRNYWQGVGVSMSVHGLASHVRKCSSRQTLVIIAPLKPP